MTESPDNFLGIPEEFSSYAAAKAVILPLPFDGTSTFMKGADKGPAALIKASQQVELFDIESWSEPYKIGIHTASPVQGSTGKEFNAAAEKATAAHLNAGKFVLGLGGEHSVTLGPVKAHFAKYPKLSILQLDAHTDQRNDFHGDPLNHACIMARCREFVSNVVQVGIRSMDASEIPNLSEGRVFFAERLQNDPNWIERVVNLLSPHVYVTIDLDVFDPSIMPSTGTPEPGGLGWYEVVRLLKRVSERCEIVGADIVELCPGKNQGPDFLAAKLAYKILSYKFGKGR